MLDGKHLASESGVAGFVERAISVSMCVQASRTVAGVTGHLLIHTKDNLSQEPATIRATTRRELDRREGRT